MKQAIIVTGNIVDGFKFTGPFPDKDAAIQEADGSKEDWNIATLEAPEAGGTPWTAQQLSDHYSTETSWGEHPEYLRSSWQYHVECGDTQVGYWDWVVSQIEQEGN